METVAIEPRVLNEWQHISNLVSKFCDVPSALLMRQHANSMEVVVSSEHPGSPYRAHDIIPLCGGLYCEDVIKKQQPLRVSNALIDPHWDHNPDIKLGMIFYFGVPVNWPDGRVFGTFCILSNTEKWLTELEAEVVTQFAQSIELTLALLSINEKLYLQSITDELTQVPNRRHFFSCLQKEFQRAKRHNSTFCVAMIDLDNFKKINDQFGHEAGDDVLINFAGHLQHIIRSEDTLGRIGGEEFALVMPQTLLKEAQFILERFKSHFKIFELPQSNKRITFSAGLAELNNNYESADGLLNQADKLLYRAKQQGRNQICI